MVIGYNFIEMNKVRGSNVQDGDYICNTVLKSAKSIEHNSTKKKKQNKKHINMWGERCAN